MESPSCWRLCRPPWKRSVSRLARSPADIAHRRSPVLHPRTALSSRPYVHRTCTTLSFGDGYRSPGDRYRDLESGPLGRARAGPRRLPGLRRRRGSRTDPAYLSDVVRFDLPLLGDIDGLRGVHLQCHIGTDTVSLARLGARMTGLDFSARRAGRGAAGWRAPAGADVDFVEADVYDAARRARRRRFDLVFTGIGALCWLPDIARWARGGRRPAAPRAAGCSSARDTRCCGRWRAARRRPAHARLPLLRAPRSRWSGTSPAPTSRPTPSFAHTPRHEWNHGLGEIVTALLDAGMRSPG